MSSEIEFSASDTPARPGKRCRYCARILTIQPPDAADESQQHCPSSGCNWCQECATGQTSVSPVNAKGETA
jgi:hypothetical protein